MSAMAVAMAVGRFAYTPLLPAMRAGAGLTPSLAGIVAAANFTGYLLGALLAGRPQWRPRRILLLQCAIGASVATTLLMAVPSVVAWIPMRFLSGVASGFVFVLASSLVIDAAAAAGRPTWIAIFYAAVGGGIALTGVLAPILIAHGGWQAGWLGLGVLCGIASIVTAPWLHEGPRPSAQLHAGGSQQRAPRAFWWLLAAYGGEGFGYIIPATFMVAMFSGEASLAPYANASWVIVGCVAVPSIYIWNRIALRTGRGRALALALGVQAGGMLAPVVFGGATGAVLAAVTLGGTFMGITGLGNGLGRELEPQRSLLAVGRLTVAYGLGQIAGPIAAAVLASNGNYARALLAAAIATLVCAAIAAIGFARGDEA